jgi:hypothetical protein
MYKRYVKQLGRWFCKFFKGQNHLSAEKGGQGAGGNISPDSEPIGEGQDLTLRVFTPKAGKYFDLQEKGILFLVGDKTLCLFKGEVIEMLLKKYDELPEDRKTNSEKSKSYPYKLYGRPFLEAI